MRSSLNLRWDVRLGAEPVHAATDGDSGVVLTCADGSQLHGDALLVAAGRVPNTDQLDAAAGGLDVHPDGRIAVDTQQRTSVSGVWALGDVSSEYQLKHVANHEARVVQHNLLTPDAPRHTDNSCVPSAVFTSPRSACASRTVVIGDWHM